MTKFFRKRLGEDYKERAEAFELRRDFSPAPKEQSYLQYIGYHDENHKPTHLKYKKK